MFAHQVGKVLVSRNPSLLTQEFSKADRGGRILVDTGRNGYSATFAAAYAVRARPGAPVSAPCTWDEMERGDVAPRTFTLRTMAARTAMVGDLWADMSGHPQSIRDVKALQGADHENRAPQLRTRNVNLSPNSRNAASDP
jgi:bifunctional non-homologous end joining protein LigD